MLNQHQLSLNFSKSKITSGKKLSRIPVACSEEFKSFVEMVARILDVSTSELSHRYILEGMQRDIGNIFMSEPHLDKSLKQIISKFG